MSGGGTPSEAWPGEFSVRHERGAAELLLIASGSGAEDSLLGASGARLLSLSESWDDFFLSLADAEAHGGGAAGGGEGSGSVFEWYELTCADLWPYIGPLLSPGLKMLHIGCGTSTLGSDAFDRVLTEHGKPLSEVSNIDFSGPAIDALAAQGAHLTRPGVRNMVMDATQTSFADGAHHAETR